MKERLLPELDRVMLWEPDVEVEDGDCMLDENGEVIITATIDVTFED